MELIRTLDRELLELATALGGTGPWREAIVFFLAEVLPLAAAGAIFWLFAKAGHTRPQRDYNREIVIVIIGGVLLAFGIRILIGDALSRPRPFVTYPELPHLSIVQNSNVSFPSLHAFVLFTIGGTVAFIGRHPKVAIGLLLLAFVVGAARVVAGVHYPSDIIGGALLGLALAKLLSIENFWVHRQLA